MVWEVVDGALITNGVNGMVGEEANDEIGYKRGHLRKHGGG
jgi:hypothetical protein